MVETITRLCQKGLHYYPTSDRRCKKCATEASKKWIKEHRKKYPEYRKEESKKRYLTKKEQDPSFGINAHLKTRYGLTLKQKQELIEKQNGKCANLGCSYLFQNISEACIDHDHSCCPGQYTCGKCIRGILCNPCNRALGNIKDSKEKLCGLLQYLGDASWKK